MDNEYRLISNACSSDNVFVVKAGIGKVNAAVAAVELIDGKDVDAVLNIGVAGSMSPDFVEGDTIAANRTAYHDMWCGMGCLPGQVQSMPLYFEADPFLLAKALEVPGVRTGLTVTGDQFYISREEDARILGMYPDAVAADMESAAIAQVCHLKGVPFLSFRIISDTHTDGKQAEHYDGFWESLAEKAFAIVGGFLGKLEH